MASFKGIKERINSVKTTRKITSAMKMVSAAKLHRAQKVIINMQPYSRAMQQILRSVFAGGKVCNSILTEPREVKRVSIVVFSSDSSLAGSFNSSVGRMLRDTVAEYHHLGHDNISVYTIGKKINEAARKCGYNVAENFPDLAAKPNYDVIADLASKLTADFMNGETDRVELIYHHFKSTGSQVLTRENFLPITVDAAAVAMEDPEEEMPENFHAHDYIFEPERDRILETLLPLSLRLKIYTALLDSNASEHAARMIAMQSATENADKLIAELTIEYNKSRQQAITNELLDMIGGQIN